MLRPNDGYIVDSLGWAYYRLHRYKDAVATLERAIELRPEDSTINDHLGDAYWQVGPQAGSDLPVGACARHEPRAGPAAGDPREAETRAQGGRQRHRRAPTVRRRPRRRPRRLPPRRRRRRPSSRAPCRNRSPSARATACGTSPPSVYGNAEHVSAHLRRQSRPHPRSRPHLSRHDPQPAGRRSRN